MWGFVLKLMLGAILACVSIGVLLAARDEVDKVGGWLLAFIGGLVMAFSMVPKQTGQYYLPAEIVAQNTYYTYFASEDGNLFASEIRPWHDNRYPYLLCMDTMGTTHVEDDEILVVWRTE